MSVVLGIGVGASHREATCSAPRAGGGRGGVGAGAMKPPTAGRLFPAPSLVSFISVGSQRRADPDPPHPAKPAGPLPQPLPSFLLILIGKTSAERGSQEGNTDVGSGSHTSTSMGCPVCQTSVLPEHPLAPCVPMALGRGGGAASSFVQQPQGCGGGHTRTCSTKAGMVGAGSCPGNSCLAVVEGGRTAGQKQMMLAGSGILLWAPGTAPRSPEGRSCVGPRGMCPALGKRRAGNRGGGINECRKGLAYSKEEKAWHRQCLGSHRGTGQVSPACLRVPRQRGGSGQHKKPLLCSP